LVCYSLLSLERFSCVNRIQSISIQRRQRQKGVCNCCCCYYFCGQQLNLQEKIAAALNEKQNTTATNKLQKEKIMKKKMQAKQIDECRAVASECECV